MEARTGGAGRSGGVGADGVPAEQSIRFDLRRTGHSDWRALASLSIRPHPALEITSGLSSAPFQFSLGACIAWSGAEYHQSFRHHRDLGATWLSTLGLSRKALGNE
jgi:hypothetical protein